MEIALGAVAVERFPSTSTDQGRPDGRPLSLNVRKYVGAWPPAIVVVALPTGAWGAEPTNPVSEAEHPESRKIATRLPVSATLQRRRRSRGNGLSPVTVPLR